MKNVLTKISALMLVLWYLLSVTGFDVHTCSGSGETYIATVIGGTACEDIHPQHEDTGCGCCHHKHEDSPAGESQLETMPCCTDAWQVIRLTGVPVGNEQATFTALSHDYAVAAVLMPSTISSDMLFSCGLQDYHLPRPRDFVPVDFCRAYNIWRI